MNGPLLPNLSEPKPEVRRYELDQLPEGLSSPAALLEKLKSPEFLALRMVQEKLGATFYLEGGTIRDTLLNKEAKDFDFVVTFPEGPKNSQYKTSADMIKAFEDSFGERTFPKGPKSGWVIKSDLGKLEIVGERFGVYRFYPKGSDVAIDISLPRTEFSTEEGLGGAKNVQVFSNPRLSFEQEAQRRDFTVNGMGLALTFLPDGDVHGVLVDPVGGIPDLVNKKLRAIGDPRKRLEESLDRVTRGIRFGIAKGLTPDETLVDAMREVISGPDGAFKRKYPDGRFVMGRPNVGINIAKSLLTDATATLDFCDQVGATADLFRHWTEVTAPKNLPKETKPVVREAVKHLDSPKNADIRAEHYQLAKASIARHQKANLHASIDEIMFLMSIDLGKLTAFETDGGGGKTVYKADYIALSKQYFLEIIRENGLIDQDPATPYRVHQDRVLKWMDNWHTIVGYLSDPTVLEGGEKAQVISRVLPEFENDPLWKMAKSYFTDNPKTQVAASRIVEFEERVKVLREDSKEIEFDQQTLLNGSQLMTCFGMKSGPALKKLIQASYTKYWEAVFEFSSPISLEQAKLSIFLEISSRPDFRSEWAAGLSGSDEKILAGSGDPEIARRAVNRAMEKQAFLKYMGSPMEAYVDDPVFGPEYKRKYGPIDYKDQEPRVELINLLADRLAENPEGVLDWLETKFEEKNSMIGRLLPEIAAMRGCTQSRKYHSEGDVWVHTRLLFTKAKELGIPLTPDLALMILYHDAGKPETREEGADGKITFKGHAEVGGQIFRDKLHVLGVPEHAPAIQRVIDMHMTFLEEGKLKTARDVRNAFPRGIHDDLYKFMLLDTAASIPESGVRNDEPIFVPIKKWSAFFELEDDYHSGKFESEVLVDENIDKLAEIALKSGRHVPVYEAYLGLLTKEARPSATEVFEVVLLNDAFARLEYIKRFLHPARTLGLSGRAISEFQQARSAELLAELTTKYSQKIQTIA